MGHISVFGQMNIDILFDNFGRLPELGEEVIAKDFDVQLGGGPMVYPIVLNRLGIESRLGTFLSNDFSSRLAIDMLKDIGYHNYTNFYDKKEGHPVVVTSVLSFPTDRSFICYNQGIRENSLSEEAVYNFLKGSKVVFAPHGFNNVMQRLKQEGTKIIFDTGWEDDLHISQFKETLKYVDVFTPNDKEALKMTRANTLHDAVKILAGYVKHPIISIGAEGCLTYYKGEVVRVPMPAKFNAIDTTGAGDNFLAGVIYGLYHDWDIIRCMQMGNILGGYSTTALGCYKAGITKGIAMEYMQKYK